VFPSLTHTYMNPCCFLYSGSFSLAVESTSELNQLMSILKVKCKSSIKPNWLFEMDNVSSLL